MDVYLPIANLAVNGLVIVLLGALTGILSGIFGVGGGFLTTPLLIFYGVPPTVAAASAATQVTGASVSGVFAHGRRNGVDYQMGLVLVAGGVVGAVLGAGLFNLLTAWGQIDTVINILYVVLLGTIGSLMLREAIQTMRRTGAGADAPRAAKPDHTPIDPGLAVNESGLEASANVARLKIGLAAQIERERGRRQLRHGKGGRAHLAATGRIAHPRFGRHADGHGSQRPERNSRSNLALARPFERAAYARISGGLQRAAGKEAVAQHRPGLTAAIGRNSRRRRSGRALSPERPRIPREAPFPPRS